MFDIGFWEIIFILLIALVVVGPERLPKLAYTVGKWVGKGRAMVSSVKSEIDREMKLEELKQVLEEQKKSLNPLEEIIEEGRTTAEQLKSHTTRIVEEGQSSAEPRKEESRASVAATPPSVPPTSSPAAAVSPHPTEASKE